MQGQWTSPTSTPTPGQPKCSLLKGIGQVSFTNVLMAPGMVPGTGRYSITIVYEITKNSYSPEIQSEEWDWSQDTQQACVS